MRPSVCEFLHKTTSYDIGAFDFGGWTGVDVQDGEGPGGDWVARGYCKEGCMVEACGGGVAFVVLGEI